jgi:hypothetical protein
MSMVQKKWATSSWYTRYIHKDDEGRDVETSIKVEFSSKQDTGAMDWCKDIVDKAGAICGRTALLVVLCSLRNHVLTNSGMLSRAFGAGFKVGKRGCY